MGNIDFPFQYYEITKKNKMNGIIAYHPLKNEPLLENLIQMLFTLEAVYMT